MPKKPTQPKKQSTSTSATKTAPEKPTQSKTKKPTLTKITSAKPTKSIPPNLTRLKLKFVDLKANLKRRKVAVCIGMFIILALAVSCVLMIHGIIETRRLDATSVVLSDNLTANFESDVKISNYLWYLDGDLIEDTTINTSRLGKVEVEFKYYNVKHRKRTKKFTIEVIDATAPLIYGKSDYTVTLGYEDDLTNLILSGDNLDDYPTREIKGAYDLNKVGNYPLEYVISDASGNTSRHSFTLHVVKPANSNKSSSTAGSASDGTPISEIIKNYKNGNTQVGIDVSVWQGEIDWAKVRAAGVEFAFLRVGYQTDYGGEYTLDSTFLANLAGATRAGLAVGVYFYSCADNVDEARRQADWVLAQVGDYPLTLGVAFDWEEWGSFNRAGMSFYTLSKVADAFLETVESRGYNSLLYGSKNYLDKFWGRNTRPVWLAQYYDYPTYTKPFKIWQLTDTGAVPGINGYVDVDVLYEQ